MRIYHSYAPETQPPRRIQKQLPSILASFSNTPLHCPLLTLTHPIPNSDPLSLFISPPPPHSRPHPSKFEIPHILQKKTNSPAIASPASIQNTPFPSSTKATAKGARLEEAQQLASPGPAQIGTYAGATAAASGGMGGGGAAIPMTTAKDQFASPALRASPMAGDSEPISTPTASGAIEPRRIGFSPSQGLTASVQFEGMGESEDVVRTPPPATDSTGKFLMIPTPPSVEKSAGGASLSAGRRGMESAGSDARDRVETPQLKYMMKSALKESSEVCDSFFQARWLFLCGSYLLFNILRKKYCRNSEILKTNMLTKSTKILDSPHVRC